MEESGLDVMGGDGDRPIDKGCGKPSYLGAYNLRRNVDGSKRLSLYLSVHLACMYYP